MPCAGEELLQQHDDELLLHLPPWSLLQLAAAHPAAAASNLAPTAPPPIPQPRQGFASNVAAAQKGMSMGGKVLVA
jgi:hypothetical protein